MIVVNWDVLRGPEYDLREPSNVRRVIDMITSGVFAGVHAGPPCATWPPVLHAGGGPPNVRTRDHPWGRPDLYSLAGWAAHEERLARGNWYLLRAHFALKSVAYTGGSCSLEHPRDRGCHPFPSIWQLEETADIEKTPHPRQLTYQRLHIDQCMLGAGSRKPTTLSTNGWFSPVLRGARCVHEERHVAA